MREALANIRHIADIPHILIVAGKCGSYKTCDLLGLSFPKTLFHPFRRDPRSCEGWNVWFASRSDPREIYEDRYHTVAEALCICSPSLYPSMAMLAKAFLNRDVQRVKACSPNKVQMSDGVEIDTHTFVWAAGTAPSPILDLVDVPRSKSGRVEVDTTMTVKDCPQAWAVGDSAIIPDLVTGGTCSPTAQYALRQGRRLADNIAATIRGDEPQPFRFKATGPSGGARASLRRRRDFWPAFLRIHCLVVVADGLSHEAARLRAKAPRGA